MNNDNGKIWLGIGLDNSQLEQDIRKSQAAFKNLGDRVSSEAARMDNAFSGVAKSVASLGAAWSAQEFVRKVATVRGEFQKLEVAFNTMLGSASKAEALMAQMVHTAAITPFGLNDVANGAKQLLAYGLEAEKVNETLIRLGDIAAGLSIPLNDIVYLYGTTMAQGRLYTQDLNQFTGRGIPMIAELAKQFGVAESKVKGLVEEGKVGFPEVQKAIESLTDEGGRFGGLMEAQSKTITGQIANIEDAIEVMFNEIGQSNEGIINDALGAVSLLVDNYKAVSDVLLTAVASYGVYKATLMGVAAYTSACYSYEIEQLQTIIGAKGMEVDADLAAAVSKGRMTSARAAEVQALRQELAAKIEAAKADAVVAAADAREATRKRMLAQLAYQKARAEVEAKQEEISAMEGLYAHQTAETLQKEKDILVTKMHAAQEKLDAAAKVENAAKTKAATTAQAVNTLTTQRDTLAKKLNVTQTKLLTLCTNGLTKAFKSLKAAFASNPLGLIMMVVTTAIGAFMTLSDTMADTSEEVERFGESAVKQSRNVDTLLAVINNTSAKSKVHKDAVNELVKIYQEYGIRIDDERSKLEQLNGMRQEAIRLIRQEGEERQKANLVASYEEALTSAAGDMKTRLQEALQEAKYVFESDSLVSHDATEYRERAKELATIIGSIIQSEGEELARLSGDAYERKLQEINAKIQKAYQDLGLGITETFGKAVFKTDVDEIGILEDYMEHVQGIYRHRQKLIESIQREKAAVEEETEAVDYQAMSFGDLFNAAYHAKQEVAKVGTLRPEPIVNTSSIDSLIEKTDTAINNLFLLNGQLGWSGGYQMPRFDFSSQSFVTEDSRPSQESAPPLLPSATAAAANEPQRKALDELDRRVVQAIKTRKGTSDLLKEVNEALDSAEAGTDDEKRLLSLQQRLQAQQKKFKGTSGKTGETASQRAADITKAAQDTQETLKQTSLARMELETSLHFQEEQNRINLERDASKRRREQMQLDHEKELSELERQKQAAVEAEIQRQKAVFDAHENEKKARDKNYVKQYFSEADIDRTQTAAIEQQYQTLLDQTLQMHKRNEAELVRSEMQSMQDYLKNYGTFQQQKLAIAQEYAQKIKAATTEGERLSLERERDSRLAGIEASALKSDMNWQTVFGEFGSMFESMVRPALEDAKRYMQTNEFKNADQDSQKALVEAVQQMEQSLGGAGEVSFKQLANEVKAYQKAMRDLSGAQTAYRASFDTLQQAQEDYAIAVEYGTEAEREAAERALAVAQANEHAAASEVQNLSSIAADAQKIMTDTATTLKTSMDGVVSGLQKLASGSLGGAYEGLVELGNNAEKIGGSLGKAFGKLADKLESVPIVGWILSIVDIFKDGLSDVIGGLLDAVYSAVNGIISDVLSGDLFVTVGKSVIDGIGSIFDTITFGGFSSWFSSSNAEEVYAAIDALTERNASLQGAIEDLTDEIKAGKGSKSVEAYKQAADLQRQTNANLLGIAKEWSGYHGSHHSWGYYWEGFTPEQIARLSGQIGRQWDGSLWSLSPEEMAKLLGNADMRDRIYNTGKGYYGEHLVNYLTNYANEAGKLAELQTQLYEGLTGMTFDSMYDSFVDALMDMDASAEDFADNLSEYFMRAMLSNKIGELYSDKLEEWWKKFGAAMEDNDLTDAERTALTDEYMRYVDEAMKLRDDFAAATGYDSTASSSTSQDSTKKGFATASQDSVDELNGRFTAVQMDTNAIRELVAATNAEFTALRLAASGTKTNTDEIKNLSLLAIDHLETISKNTHELFEMNKRLASIEKNTRKI